MRKAVKYPLILIACLIALPAYAHHSYAMFDNKKVLTLEGTVRDFQWTNPHSWIRLVVTDRSGKPVEIAIEGGSPNQLARQGWKRSALKPGDRAAIAVHPYKDGTPGGALLSATVGGRTFGGQEETPAPANSQ